MNEWHLVKQFRPLARHVETFSKTRREPIHGGSTPKRRTAEFRRRRSWNMSPHAEPGSRKVLVKCLLSKSKIVLLVMAQLMTFPVNSSAQAASRVPETSSLLLQTLLGLVFVVCMIFALAWLARRMNLTGLQRNQHCRILATMPVSAREKVILVDIAGQQLLLGVAPGNITTLHTFGKPAIETTEPAPTSVAVKCQSRLAARSPAEFSRKLAEFLGQGNRSS